MIRLLEFDERISREEFSRLQRKISSAYDSFYRLPDDIRYKLMTEEFYRWEDSVLELLRLFGISNAERDFLMNGEHLWDAWHEWSFEDIKQFLENESKER